MIKQLFTALFFLFLCNNLFAQEEKSIEIGSDVNETIWEQGISALYFSKSLGIKDSVKYPKLYNTIKGWLYTKYHYGGHTDKGIDCSGFTKALCSEAFGISLTGGGSASIFQQDVLPIEKDSLKEGDLVFFIIRKKRISHIGVYLGHNKFVHASRHAGVIVSKLSNSYYKKHFYKAGRLKSFIYAQQ